MNIFNRKNKQNSLKNIKDFKDGIYYCRNNRRYDDGDADEPYAMVVNAYEDSDYPITLSGSDEIFTWDDLEMWLEYGYYFKFLTELY